MKVPSLSEFEKFIDEYSKGMYPYPEKFPYDKEFSDIFFRYYGKLNGSLRKSSVAFDPRTKNEVIEWYISNFSKLGKNLREL